MQRLSSWGQRFSVVNRYMRPFVSILYSEYAGRSQHVSFTLSPRAVRVIRLFRVLICLMLTDPVRFSRPLRSFVPGKARILIEFDASLTGVGLLYYRLDEGVEFLVGGGSVDISVLGFQGQAAHQNTAEFVAIVLGVRGLCQIVEGPCVVWLRGDSETALHWARREQFRGQLIGNAAVVSILQEVYTKTEVAGVTHLAGTDNWRTDQLSRGGSLQGLYEHGGIPFIPHEVLLEGDAVIQLCDPKRDTAGERAFEKFWGEVRRVLE